jgi:glycosyltransferase involved in cell wall biosynthesis
MKFVRPRILFVTPHCPCGQSYGGRIRAFNIGKLLQRVGEVSLVLVPPDSIPQEEVELTKKYFDLRGIFPQRTIPRRLVDRFRMEVDPTFWGVRNQIISEEDRKLFCRLYQDHDLVWFHTVRPPDALKAYYWKKSVLDVDDLQSHFYSTFASTTPSFLRTLLDLRMQCLWRRREKRFLDRFSILCVCSMPDKNLFENDERVYVVSNGYELTETSDRRHAVRRRGNRIGFIGLFDYLPNREGVSWFINEVWPIVKKALPDTKLRLVGKGTDDGSYDMDIDGLGWIPDVESEMDSWSAMIVPIRHGSGTRIKIAEAFARRCPVVSTHLGAYGYDLKNGREAILADTPSEFAQGCIELMKSSTLRETLSTNAFQKYNGCLTWEAQRDAVAKAVCHCLDLQRA